MSTEQSQVKSHQSSNTIPGSIAEQVTRSVQDAASPLDFIKNNLKPITEIPDSFVKRQEAKQPPKPIFTETPKEEVPPVQPTEIKAETPPEEVAPKVEPVQPQPQVEPVKETPKGAAELLEEVKEKSPEQSLKDMRKSYLELKKTAEEKDSLIKQAEEKVKKYETGEAIPEVLQKEKERIAQLEKYERLYSLKTSPEYQQTYIQPLKKLEDDANRLVTEYQVQPEVFNHALTIQNKRELNSFLKDHFDDVGALEVREVINKIKDIQTKAQVAEQEPARELETLQSEFQKKEGERAAQRIDAIINHSKDGWGEALTQIQQEGIYPELAYRENDEKHNAVVKPIIEEASKEFGKFVTLLGHLGIKELPKDVAKMLAQRFQTSQAAPLMAMSRANHYKTSQEIRENVKREAYLLRPPVGSSGGGGSVGGEAPPVKSPEQTGADLINSVLARKGRR